MKNWKKRKIGAICCIFFFVIITFFPLSMGNKILKMATTEDLSPLDNSTIKVTCYTSTYDGLHQVEKEVNLEQWDKLRILATEFHDSNINNFFLLERQEKFNKLFSKLDEINLITNTIVKEEIIKSIFSNFQYSKIFSNILKNIHLIYPNNTTSNYLNFIFGLGKDGTCTDLKSAITGGSLSQLILLRILFYNFFNVMFNIISRHPRAFVGFGFVEFCNGGNITTIGLKGNQEVSGEDNVIITLQGFIGIIICSCEESFIFGFSLASGLYN